jgi:mRNA-degrading endonuclease RelE of RelBE toxin-antitoxin system
MLYKIIHDQDIFELNPGLRAVEKYAKLTDKQMKVVLLVCDPSKDNPIKTLTGADRRVRACVLAGYPYESDGKRLAKNARDIVQGKVQSIEDAIEEFKKNHYNERDKNKEALRKHIAEVRDFLTSDKKVPVVGKQGIVLDKEGNEVWVVDQKALKLASELGEKLPGLEKALKELEDLDPQDNQRFEGAVPTAADVEEVLEEGAEDLPAIEKWHSITPRKDQ